MNSTATPQVFGHRGNPAAFADNTLEGLLSAVQAGAHGVEIDVRLTRDGLVVLSHDPAIAGRLIRETPACEISAPLLVDALSLLPDTCRINVEIKCLPEDPDAACQSELIERCVAIVTESGDPRIEWSSFAPEACVTLRRKMPDAPVSLLLHNDGYGDALVWAIGNGMTGINPHIGRLTPAFGEEVHDAGLEISVWTVNRDIDAQRCVEMGVNTIITDRPACMVELFKRDVGPPSR